MLGAGEFRGEDGVETVGGERGDGGVVEDACRVHDGGDGMFGEQRRHGVAVGDVTGDDAHVRIESGQVGGAAAADQDQVADTVPLDEVAGQCGTEDAGAAGDQNAAVRAERRGRGRLRPREPGRDHTVPRHPHPGFVAGKRRRRVLGRLHQDDASGVLGLGRPDQPARGGRLRPVADDERDGLALGPEDAVQNVECLPRGGDTLGGRRVRAGDGDPVEPEQRAVDGIRQRGDGPQSHRGDLGDRRARAVGGQDGHGVLRTRSEPDPQSGRARSEQADTGTRERQPSGSGIADERAERGGMQGGVEQRRVHAEPLRRALGQDDLGEDLVTPPPYRAQVPEGGAVGDTGGGEGVVDTRDVDGLGTRGRPIPQRRRRFGGDGDRALGVVGPRIVGATAGMNVHGPGPGGIRSDGDLDVHAAVVQHQRGDEGQVGDGVAADLATGAQREFEQGGAGDHDPAGHDVVGQPGVGPGGEPAGEHGPVVVGEGQGGTEQGMFSRRETRGGHVAGAAAGRQPEAAFLEGVGGQVDAAAAGHHRGPVRRDAVHDGLTQGEQHPLQAAVVPLERADRDDVVRQGHRQHRMRGTLHDGAEPVGHQSLDSTGEPDGGAEVVEPIPGVHPRAVLNAPGQRRIHGHSPRTRPDRLQHLQQLVAQLVDLRRVGGVIHRDPLRPHTVGRTGGDQLVEGLRLTRHHHSAGAVDRGDRDPVTERCDPVANLGLTQRDRDHPATTRELLQHPRPQGNHPGTVLQRQRPRDHSSSDLTLRMTHHRIRLDPPRAPQLRQRHHHSPQHRLHHIDPTQQIAITQRGVQGEIGERLQRRSTLRQPLREHRRLLRQLTRHPDPLRTLTGKYEHRPPRLAGCAAHERRVGLARRERSEGGRQLSTVTGQHGPLIECGAPGQGPGDVGEIQIGAVGQESLRLPEERGFGATGQHPRNRGALDRGGCLGLGRLLQDDVRVGAADTERRHRRPPGPVHVGPRTGVGQQFDGARGPVHVRGGLVDVEGLRQDRVPQRADGLDHTGDARGGLGVPDVRLHRPQVQRLVAILPVGGQQRSGLDRVAQRRAGAVRLDEVDIGHSQSGVFQGLQHDALLGGTVGGGEPVGRAIGVDRRATHDGEHGMPVALGVREPFEQENARALAPSGAIGGVGERLAAAVAGEAALAGELDETVGGGHDGGAARQRERALPRAEGAGRQMQRDQRRRARRVDGDGRSLDAEGVGEPSGEHARGVTGGQVPGRLGGRVQQQRGVVLAVGAREDADPLAAHAPRVEPGPLERLPADLQHQALLGIHRHGLARRDSEQVGVEGAGRVEEPAFLCQGGGTQTLEVPAAVGGERPQRVGSARGHLPQVLGRGDAAGEAARGGDDGDRLGQSLPLLLELPAGTLQVGRDQLQVVTELVLARQIWRHLREAAGSVPRPDTSARRSFPAGGNTREAEMGRQPLRAPNTRPRGVRVPEGRGCRRRRGRARSPAAGSRAVTALGAPRTRHSAAGGGGHPSPYPGPPNASRRPNRGRARPRSARTGPRAERGAREPGASPAPRSGVLILSQFPLDQAEQLVVGVDRQHLAIRIGRGARVGPRVQQAAQPHRDAGTVEGIGRGLGQFPFQPVDVGQ